MNIEFKFNYIFQSFVYVSTAFSNNSQNDSRIVESVFKSNLSIETAKALTLIDDPTLDSLTPRYHK